MATAIPASAASLIQTSEWKPAIGDELIVDVESNTGYLIHTDGSYLPFLVATGLQKNIRYLGRTYFAQTPLKEWVAKEKKIQTDKVMFGKTGRFFRLFDGGTVSTPYGIHSFKYVDDWMKDEDRYRSYGCVVVTEEILDIVEDTFYLNGKALKVKTIFGLEQFIDELAERERPPMSLYY